MEETDEIMKDIRTIRITLVTAQQYGLQIEVLFSAFKARERNPKLTIAEAMTIGLNEWVK